MQHLVMYSGGLAAFSTARRVLAEHGRDHVILLFADTLIEDTDTYRFLIDSAAHLAGVAPPLREVSLPPLADPPARRAELAALAAKATAGIPLLRWITDGRTPWEVIRARGAITDTAGQAVCSAALKRDLLNRWRADHCQPETTRTHYGFDWTEGHRLAAVARRDAPWPVHAPLNEPPHLDRLGMMQEALRAGLQPPELAGLGFPRTNCGGFCVRAGEAQAAQLWRMRPERYRWHEAQEAAAGLAVLGGQTLAQFRVGLEQKRAYDRHAWGGCGCA